MVRGRSSRTRAVEAWLERMNELGLGDLPLGQKPVGAK
jgi:hypothetical protein